MVDNIFDKLYRMSDNKNAIYASIANELLAMDGYKELKIKHIENKCNVSSTTVFRFCKNIGVSGFSELKFLLMQVEESCEKIKFKGNYASINEIENEYQRNIITSFAETRKLLDEASLDAIVCDIERADRINIYAAGITFLTAQDLEYKFDRININAKAFQDSNRQYYSAYNACEKTLSIGLSYSGASESVINSLHLARDKGAKTLLITSVDNANFEDEFDHVLYIAATDHRYRLATTTSRLVMLYVVDLIYYRYITKHANDLNDMLIKSVFEQLENKY